MKKILIGVAFLLLDRLTKWHLLNNPNLYSGDFLKLKLFSNKGFYFFSFGENTNLIISVVAAFILILLFTFVAKEKVLPFGVLLIMVGGMSNLFDRIYYGFVIDFIWIKIFPISIFNIADVLIIFGLICLLFNLKKFK
jgi:signal peptidase II